MSKLPEGGLTAYANRVRADHRRLPNGWCSCDKPLCPERYLLDHVDELIQSYELKVQDLAQETARYSDLHAKLRDALGMNAADEDDLLDLIRGMRDYIERQSPEQQQSTLDAIAADLRRRAVGGSLSGEPEEETQ